MLLTCKSASIAVNEENLEQDLKSKWAACATLTVWRKSLVFSCQGFTVIGPDGSLVYRVDNYTGRPGRVILMDGTGKPILTMLRRKKLGLVDNWLIFEGEIEDCSRNKKAKEPIFIVRKSMMNILQVGYLNVLAYIYGGNGMDDKRYSYVIEGSYAHRSCRVLDHESKRVVAEIKKKESMKAGISFGVEVFLLIVRPGFDSGFAMALILLLDQMFS